MDAGSPTLSSSDTQSDVLFHEQVRLAQLGLPYASGISAPGAFESLAE